MRKLLTLLFILPCMAAAQEPGTRITFCLLSALNGDTLPVDPKAFRVVVTNAEFVRNDSTYRREYREPQDFSKPDYLTEPSPYRRFYYQAATPYVPMKEYVFLQITRIATGEQMLIRIEPGENVRRMWTEIHLEGIPFIPGKFDILPGDFSNEPDQYGDWYLHYPLNSQEGTLFH